MHDLVSWLVAAVVLAAVAALMVRLSLWPKVDVLETHESAVVGAAALLCMASYVILMAMLGVCLALKNWSDGGPLGLFVSLPLALALLFPLASAGYTFLRLSPLGKKALEADAEAGPGLQADALGAADSLGISSAVDVRLSAGKRQYHGPTTLGRWGAPPVVVLPVDLEETIGLAASGRADAARALVRFILLHELAHIRNGDYQIHSWVSVFLRAMRWWPLVLLPVLSGYSVFAGTWNGFVILGGVTWLSIILSLLLLLSWRPLQRHRENLADARAASCLLPSEIQVLVSPGECGLSPLETLAAYTGIRQGLRPETPGAGDKSAALRRLWASAVRLLQWLLKPEPLRASAEFLRRLADTHPSSEDRRALLTSGELLAESRQQVSYRATASIFASVGMAFFTLMAAILMPSGFWDIPTAKAPLAGLLVVAVFTTAALLCMPFRNATTAAVPLRASIPALLGRSLVGGAALFATFVVVSLPAVAVIPAQGLEFLGIVAPLCLLLSAGTFIISTLFAATIGCGVMCRAPLSMARSLRPLILVGSLFYGPTASVAVVMGLSWDSVSMVWRENPAWLAYTLVVALCGAVWSGAVVLRHFIRSASDVTYIRRELWKEGLAPGIVAAAVFAALSWGGVSLGRAVNDMLLPWPLARPWVDALALAVATASVFLFVCAAQRRSVAVLSSCSELTRLLWCTGQALSPAMRDWLVGKVGLHHAETGGYAWSPRQRPDLDATRDALSILEVTGTGLPSSAVDAQWVLRHRVRDGGFAGREGGVPSLSATRAALECLGYLRHELSEDERQAATRWVSDLQKEDGGFNDGTEMDRVGLESAYDAVACLQRLGGLERIDRAAALRFVSSAWAKSGRTVDETYWAVYAHCGLGGLAGAMATAVRLWCLSLAPWLLRLNPKRHAGPLCKALWVMGQLPQTGDEVLGRVAGLICARAQQVVTESRQR